MNKKYLSIIILIFLLVIAGIPRSIELLNHNFLWGFDQGLFFQAVKSIVIDHKLTLIGAEVGGGGFFQGPGWYYLLAIPFALSHGNPYAAEVMMVVIGLAVVTLAYLLFRKSFGELSAILAAFFISISPGIIAQSRFIWPPFPLSLLTVLFLFCVYKTFTGDKKFLSAATFTLALTYHFEIAAGITLTLQFSFVVLFLLLRRMVSLKDILFAAIAFLIPLSPLIFFDIRHQFISTKGIIHRFSEHHAGMTFSQIFSNHWQVFYSTFLTAFDFDSVFSYAIAFIGICVCSVLFFKDKKNSLAQKLFVGYLILSPFLLFLVFLLVKMGIDNWWLLELPIIYCVLFGIVLGSLFTNKYGRFAIGGIVVLFFIFYVFETVHSYQHDFNDYGGTAKIKGKEQAYDTIYKDAHGKPFNVLVFTPPVYTYEFDYLEWWYGKGKYGYQPGHEKKGLTYLLIAPDPFKPWTYNGWLETQIATGSVQLTKKLPSGLIIQKRLIP